MYKTLLLLLLPIALVAGPNDNGDFQIWNSNTLNIKLGRKTHFVGQTQFRYGRDGSKLLYKHYQVGFRFIRSPFTHIQTAYRQIFYRIDDKWVKEFAPLLDLTFQVKSRVGWIIQDRNRLQHNTTSKKLHGGKNAWVYRNRLEIIPPVRISKSGIAPFIADEIFWRERRGLGQNRLEIGFRIPYREKTQLDLYYMYRSIKNLKKSWVHHNVLWIHFSLHF